MEAVRASQRLDYSSLAEILGQRGLVDPQRLAAALQMTGEGGLPFPEALVADNAIGDWELASVVCDLYGLAFVPVDICSPSPQALRELDVGFLRQHRLVPLSRHGHVLTVCMPGLVPAEVLGLLSAATDLQVLPVVGSVVSNAKWFQDHVPEITPAPALPVEELAGANWSSIFDEGDAAVLLELRPQPESDEPA
jgi:hypothetical protein